MCVCVCVSLFVCSHRSNTCWLRICNQPFGAESWRSAHTHTHTHTPIGELDPQIHTSLHPNTCTDTLRPLLGSTSSTSACTQCQNSCCSTPAGLGYWRTLTPQTKSYSLFTKFLRFPSDPRSGGSGDLQWMLSGPLQDRGQMRTGLGNRPADVLLYVLGERSGTPLTRWPLTPPRHNTTSSCSFLGHAGSDTDAPTGGWVSCNR